MKLCLETITIFNARLDKSLDATVYIPTVIKGVSWYGSMQSTVDANGLKAASQYTIRIPLNADTAGKTYVTPTDYAAVDIVSDVFTLNEGDIIVQGAYEDKITQPSQLKTLHGVTILAVTDNRRALHAPHWKVVGA